MLFPTIRSCLLVGLTGALLLTAPIRHATAADAKAAAEDAAPRADNFFVALKPLNVPIRRRNEITGFVALAVSLEVVDDTARSRARRLLPRVRDAFIRELFANPAVQRGTQGRIDYRRIRSVLLHRARQVLGREAVLTIYITGT